MPAEIDIILDILKSVLAAQPDSDFTNSLYRPYCERGSLSKKQLEGLHSKASKIKDIHPGKLATLETIFRQACLPGSGRHPETSCILYPVSRILYLVSFFKLQTSNLKLLSSRGTILS